MDSEKSMSLFGIKTDKLPDYLFETFFTNSFITFRYYTYYYAI